MGNNNFFLLGLLFLFIGYSGLAQNYPLVKVFSLENFTRQDSLQLKVELDLLQTKVLNNPDFWKDIKNADFGCRNRRVFHSRRSRTCNYPDLPIDKKSYSNIEIHDLLFFGNDELGRINDGKIDLNLALFSSERTSTGKIVHGRTNSCFLRISSSRNTRLYSQPAGSYAKHLLHEYMHILGFKHRSNNKRRNKRKCKGLDVPWRIQEIASKYL